MIALVWVVAAEVYNVPLPVPLLHVALLHILDFTVELYWCVLSLKKNLNASRPSEHPPVRGGNVKKFRWDHRLHRQNLFKAFKRVLLW